MSQISPPIRILLVCAVAFMAAWMLFLRPSTDAGTPAVDAPAPTASTPPVAAGGEKSQSLAGKAVEQANDATAATDARVERLADGTETAADAGSAANATGTGTAPATADDPAAPGAKPGTLTPKAAAAGGLPLRVLEAIGDHKVVVLLFWSPKSADDKAVRKALAKIDRHDGKVLAHATNLKKIAAYGQITRGADVEQSPTIVVVDRKMKVETLVGYVDRVTIDQAVTDALRNS
ncbi:MAG TPA: hypothetical protein VK631_00665 [Solirubrobacteraceae bacterium]|nr:hypothetical protein [Solirubrobacteraceae bacterium]